MVRAYWFAMENECCRADITIIVIIITTRNISDNNNHGVHIGRGERWRDGNVRVTSAVAAGLRATCACIYRVFQLNDLRTCAALLRFMRAKNTHCSAAPTDRVPLHTDDDVHARVLSAPAGGKRLRPRRQRVIRRTYLCTSCGVLSWNKKINRMLWHLTVFASRKIFSFLVAEQYYYTSTNKTRLVFVCRSQVFFLFNGKNGTVG